MLQAISTTIEEIKAPDTLRINHIHRLVYNHMELEAESAFYFLSYRDFFTKNVMNLNTIEFVEKYGTPYLKAKLKQIVDRKRQQHKEIYLIERGNINATVNS